ncbi:hypothetical protein [Natrarchaeobaculum aegyptiacum]|uniref:hypothetical protein n=1 Tax=Natrarchaeobaculum aegyptiacum TaxID=745377 RepID=UPI0012603249|nr:hypothetical protein [Natrarchaeobaculum aegyptiacum]
MAREIGEYDWERLNINERTLRSLDDESIIDNIEENWIENDQIFEMMVSTFNSMFQGVGDSAKASLGAAVVCARRSCNRRASSSAIADELSCSPESMLDRTKRLNIPSPTPEVSLREVTANWDEIEDTDYERAKEELERIPPESYSGHQDVLAAVALYRAVNELGGRSAPQGRPEKAERRLSAAEVADRFDVSRPAIHTAHKRLQRK